MIGELGELKIEVTHSMILTGQDQIASERQALEKIIPATNSVSPLGIRNYGDDSNLNNALFFPLFRLSSIGNGATSKVFKSVRLTDLQLCAEKVLIVGDSNKRHQLVTEIDLLRTLCSIEGGGEGDQDPMHIVQLYGILPNPKDGTISILLEYMNLGSLQHLVTGGGCSNEDILSSFAYQISAGLNFLHRRRLVHRDIKPSNILLCTSGKVKLSDFGIAKIMELGSSLAESFVGTFEYMAPERLSGEPYSFVADIWSMGMALHSVAIGRYPFSSKGDFWEILHAAQQSSQTLPSSSQFSESLISFIAAATNLQPNARPTAKALLFHPFISKALPTLSKDQVETIRPILQRSKQWNQYQLSVTRITMDQSMQIDIISSLIFRWKEMIMALYCTDEQLDSFPNFEKFREITVTKDMISQLSKDLDWNEAILRRSFRKALQQTKDLIGDRLRFLNKRNLDRFDFNGHQVESLVPRLQNSEMVHGTLIAEAKKNSPYSSNVIENLADLSSSINESVRNLRAAVDDKEICEYDDDFDVVDDDSVEKYCEDAFEESDTTFKYLRSDTKTKSIDDKNYSYCSDFED